MSAQLFIYPDLDAPPSTSLYCLDALGTVILQGVQQVEQLPAAAVRWLRQHAYYPCLCTAAPWGPLCIHLVASQILHSELACRDGEGAHWQEAAEQALSPSMPLTGAAANESAAVAPVEEDGQQSSTSHVELLDEIQQADLLLGSIR